MENVFVVSSAPVHISYASNVSTDMTTSEGFPVFANSVWQEAVADSAVADADWVEFSALVAAWKAETMYSSSLRTVFASAPYQRILAMPPEKLGPLIIRQLMSEADTPYHWWPALRIVTKDDPVAKRHVGNVKLMARDWIEWGRRHYGPELGSNGVS